jgi:hypothetical protein
MLLAGLMNTVDLTETNNMLLAGRHRAGQEVSVTTAFYHGAMFQMTDFPLYSALL